MPANSGLDLIQGLKN